MIGTRLIVVNGSSILLFGVNPGATKYLCTLNGSTANATWQFVGFYTEKDQLYITGISRTASPTVCVWAIQEGSETSSILISESSLFVRPDSHFVDGSLSAYLRPGLDTLLKTPWPLLFTLFSDGCLEAWQPNGNGSIVPSTDGFQVQWTKAWTQSLSANTSRFKAGPKGYVAHSKEELSFHHKTLTEAHTAFTVLAIEGQEALHISQSNDAIFMDSSMAINTSR